MQAIPLDNGTKEPVFVDSVSAVSDNFLCMHSCPCEALG